MFKDGITEEQIIANLRGEFLEDAGRRLHVLVEHHAKALRREDPEATFAAFRAELHTLKGMGQSFGFGSITMICRRLEYYLKPLSAEGFIRDAAVAPYLDALDGIIEGGEEPGEDDLEGILDSLAAPPDD